MYFGTILWGFVDFDAWCEAGDRAVMCKRAGLWIETLKDWRGVCCGLLGEFRVADGNGYVLTSRHVAAMVLKML